MTTVSFLFSYPVLHSCFFGRPQDALSTVSEDAYSECFDLSKSFQECFVYACGQDVDKINNGFDFTKKARFKETIEEENTTRGVDSFCSNSQSTIEESAKALSEKGYTIVIVVDAAQKESLESHEKIIAVTPSEFLSNLENARDIFELIPFKEKNLLEVLLLVMFGKDSHSKLRKIFLSFNKTQDVQGDAEGAVQEDAEK